jgi:acyl-CoA synthetase (AMP-forming)/AMP-acid ligase II
MGEPRASAPRSEREETSANVAELFAASVRRRPNAIALVQGTGAARREIGFAALDARARGMAARLASDGVAPGDAVLFFAAPSIELYAALIAVLRIGAVAMFVEPSAGRRVLRDACLVNPPRALVASARAHLLRLISPPLRAIPNKYALTGRIPFVPPLDRASGATRRDEIVVRDADAPALLTFTSGSTGRPKGAVRTHGILRAQLDALTGSVAASESTRELVALPIVVLVNLANGAETILPDADLRRPATIDPMPVLEQLVRERATRVTAAPAFLERLVDDVRRGRRSDRPHPRIVEVVTGGGPVFPDVVARIAARWPAARITAVYGSTEAEPIAHVAAHEQTDEDVAARRAGAGLLAGLPHPSVRLAILPARWGDPIGPFTARELAMLARPAGEPGEIVVTGAHVVRGYLGGIGDEETKFTVDGEIWHRTGDVGYLDVRGRLWLLGRAAWVIEDSRGTVYPFAVECAAREVLAIRRAVVVSHLGKRVLVVERRRGASVPDPARELGLLAWAHLDEIVAWPAIPMDRRHNSKVDYPAVRRRLERAASRSASPRDLPSAP